MTTDLGKNKAVAVDVKALPADVKAIPADVKALAADDVIASQRLMDDLIDASCMLANADAARWSARCHELQRNEARDKVHDKAVNVAAAAVDVARKRLSEYSRNQMPVTTNTMLVAVAFDAILQDVGQTLGNFDFRNLPDPYDPSRYRDRRVFLNMETLVKALKHNDTHPTHVALCGPVPSNRHLWDQIRKKKWSVSSYARPSSTGLLPRGLVTMRTAVERWLRTLRFDINNPQVTLVLVDGKIPELADLVPELLERHNKLQVVPPFLCLFITDDAAALLCSDSIRTLGLVA
jgi:hypothetical protein